MTVQYSVQKMVSDGTLSTIALGIQYLQRNDIYMRIAGEETPQVGAPSGYTWSFINNTTLKILPVVPNGVEVVVYRRTGVDAMYNVYSQNAQFDEATIDDNNQQLLYIAQEYLEQGLPGAGVDTLEYVRDDGSFTYYRLRRTDGSYSDEFTVPSASNSAKVLTREALRRSYAEAGYALVVGSFEQGGTVATGTDVLLYEAEGKAYSWDGALPKVVMAGSSPTPIATGSWVLVGDMPLRQELIDSAMRMQGGRFALRDVYSARDFGDVVGDGVADDTIALQAAIDSVPSGGSFGFMGGKFLFNKIVLSKPIVLFGDAELTHNGFRIKSSRVRSELSGRQISRAYSGSSRAFECRANEDATDYADLKILFNRFEGFFYATAFLAKDYSLVIDPNARVIKDTKIIGCSSIAPSGLNAGHFQHIGVTNSETSHCSTYGGQGATSYNFINQNGYVRVIGNYDENNLYGSCELENSKVSNSVISGNTFGNDLWVDDTSNVSITGNVTIGTLRVTSETTDVYNVNISGNVAKRIRVEQFGASPTGLVFDSNITGNTATGADAGGTDMFLGALTTGEVSSNNCNGPSTHIGVTRRANTDLVVRNNKGKAGTLLIGGTGGAIVEYGNVGMVTSGASESKHLSNMMKPSKDYLDLPGKYLHGTKFSGLMPPGATAAISLPIPVSPNPSFRGVALWVLIRDTGSNNISSFRIDGRYVYVGSVQLVFGTSYSTQGTDFAAVAVANNTSTSSSINILLTNTSGTKTLQVTVLPEVSSRLGTEE